MYGMKVGERERVLYCTKEEIVVQMAICNNGLSFQTIYMRVYSIRRQCSTKYHFITLYIYGMHVCRKVRSTRYLRVHMNDM